jgi:hypothetical protein
LLQNVSATVTVVYTLGNMLQHANKDSTPSHHGDCRRKRAVNPVRLATVIKTSSETAGEATLLVNGCCCLRCELEQPHAPWRSYCLCWHDGNAVAPVRVEPSPILPTPPRRSCTCQSSSPCAPQTGWAAAAAAVRCQPLFLHHQLAATRTHYPRLATHRYWHCHRPVRSHQKRAESGSAHPRLHRSFGLGSWDRSRTLVVVRRLHCAPSQLPSAIYSAGSLPTTCISTGQPGK